MQAAQLVHAAGESSPGNLPSGTYAIVLAVPTQKELEQLEQRLVVKGVPFRAIREPDAPWNGALMAIGVEPMPRAQVRKHLSGLSLLKDKEKKMDLKIDSKLAMEANKELERLQAWEYAFDENGDKHTWRYAFNRAHYKFKTTLMCALIAHSRGITHLANCSLEEQEKFLADNIAEWEHLRRRIPKEPVNRVKLEKPPAVAPTRKKSLMKKILEML